MGDKGQAEFEERLRKLFQALVQLMADVKNETLLTQVLKGDVTRDDSHRRFLAQHCVATSLRHCFEWLQHCSSIVTLSCAKSRRCEVVHSNITLRS